MKPYPKYKDSGVEWIGEIPEHWDAIMIKRLSKVSRGASPRPIDNPAFFDANGEFAWVRIADITASERYLENTTQRLSELGSSLSVKRHPGDFFLSIAGTVGKPIITKIKCCIHDGFVYFPSLELNPEYLYYLFSTGLPYKGLGKWGTQLNLNTDTVGEIMIPLPPEKEIESMIHFLDSRLSQIDTLIQSKQKLIELLKEERIAIINHAVTKGIDPKVKMKDSGVEWIGEIPEHWEVKKLKRVFNFHNNIRVPLSADERSGLEKKYDYYGASGVIDKVDKYLFDGEFILIGEDGANLLTRSTALAYKASGKFWVNNHAHILSPKDGNINYFTYLLESIDYTIYVTGSAQPKLTIENLGEIVLAIPTRQEQNQLNEYIQSQTSKIDLTLSRIEKEIELLREYRTALISEVVTGKLRVI